MTPALLEIFMHVKSTLTLLAALSLSAALGCGGSSSTPPPPPPPPPVVTNPVALPAGTFTATKPAPMALAMVSAPAGTMTPTLIMAPDGTGRMELDGFQHVRTGIYVEANGSLAVAPDATLTRPDGTTVPLVLSGSRIGDRLVGSTNGGSFDLTLTPMLDSPVNLATKVGTYVSTCSSNGVWARIQILSDLEHLSGEAYATAADMAAKINQIGRYQGSISHADGDTQHLKNCFNIGFVFITPDQIFIPATYGLGYFTSTGLVALTANHLKPEAGQFSATFVKE